MGVNLEKSEYIWVIYGGKGVAGQLGFYKMYWKLVFVSDFRQFLGVKFLVWSYAYVNFVTFRKSVNG